MTQKETIRYFKHGQLFDIIELLLIVLVGIMGFGQFLKHNYYTDTYDEIFVDEIIQYLRFALK